ncbi:Protein YicC [Acidisarcina polymorpha]|uniref:Protein YicC n=1 Tax=Acidisarcina polymorpha TaxID=2211140 RepID=A0A2Z5FYH5_9BACT|nr:YicC/YloC family endoribonuclease [Acidisarcina polymorpha]AXC11760.1 Protein YicC [Acidisarcina polymorpha]
MTAKSLTSSSKPAAHRAPTPSPSPIHSPIYSMTGFARLSGRVSDNLGFTLSLKSVNHRFLDPHLRMPPGTESLEMRVRRYLKDNLIRGHLEFTLTLDRGTERGARYNSSIVSAYLDAFRDAAAEHHLDQQPDLNAILRLPGVFATESFSMKEDWEALEAAVVGQLDPLIAALNAMRAQEGSSLAAELSRCLHQLSGLVDQVASLRDSMQNAYFERLSQRVAALLSGAGTASGVPMERERILQEVALLVERSDVAEEIARLRAHIEHFHLLLAAGGEIGKKADFLLQEMNREANTLLSKTSGIAGNAADITTLGLGMKAEIEKAREQVQNLE